jgi:hypothetical protein
MLLPPDFYELIYICIVCMSESDKIPQERKSSFSLALTYPFSNGLRPIGMGLLMNLLAFLVIPQLAVAGYMFKIKEYVATGEPEPPKFENIIQLSKEGAKGLASYLILYLLIFVGFGVASVLPRIGALVGLLIAAVGMYLVPAVGIFHAVDRSIIGFYTNDDFIDFVTSGHYFVSNVMYMLFIVGATVGIALGSVITLGIGALVALPLFLYLRPVFWGHRYYNNVTKKNKRTSTNTGDGATPSYDSRDYNE